jgi:antitoxin VapB
MQVRRVKLFRNGRNQAVRIPREFELRGDEALLTRDGDRLILESPRRRDLSEVLAGMTPIDDEIGPIEDLPPEPVEI